MTQTDGGSRVSLLGASLSASLDSRGLLCLLGCCLLLGLNLGLSLGGEAPAGLRALLGPVDVGLIGLVRGGLWLLLPGSGMPDGDDLPVAGVGTVSLNGPAFALE